MPYTLVDPSARLNFSHDWTDWLEPTDAIVSRLWTISPLNPGTPLTPALGGQTSDIVYVDGLLHGRIYYLTEHVTTLAGVQDERTIVLRAEHT